MRFLLVFLLAAALVAGAPGCKKPEPPEEITEYDKTIDGSVPLPPVLIDDTLLTGEEIPRDTSGIDEMLLQPAAPAAPASGDAAAEVRSMLKSVVQQVVSGNVDAIADILAADQAEALRPLLTRVSGPVKAGLRANQAAERKFGKGLQELLAEGPGPGPSPMGLAGIAQMTEALDLEVVSPSEVRPAAKPGAGALAGVKFEKVGQQWRVRLPDTMLKPIRELAEMPVVGKVIDAAEQMCLILTKGIEDGTVTKANLRQTVETLKKQELDPVMTELMMAVMPKLGEIMGAGPGMMPPPGPE